MLLSSNAFGNINLLAADIRNGLKDFFGKPYNGFVHGPLEGGKGLITGTGSLIGNTAKGTFGTVSRVSNFLSKGALTFVDDTEYVKSRD